MTEEQIVELESLRIEKLKIEARIAAIVDNCEHDFVKIASEDTISTCKYCRLRKYDEVL